MKAAVLYGNGDKEHVEAAVLVGHSLGTPVCRQVLQGGRQGNLVDIDGVYCFYDGTETPEYVEAVNQFGHAFDGPECSEVITSFVTKQIWEYTASRYFE